LNLPPDAPLPKPPVEIAVAGGIPDAAALRDLALSRRPDLQALTNRVAANQAAVDLARKEFYPDITPFAMYDRFMGNNSQSEPLATMVGLSLNLPVRRQRRFAVVAEAEARLSQRKADLEKQINQVRFEVQQAYAQVKQTQKAVRLYQETVLPNAVSNTKAAEAAYTTGKIPFLALIQAQRDLVGLKDRHVELVASYQTRLATLERVIGGGPLSLVGPVRNP
jgi:outer membrane protein TolC